MIYKITCKDGTSYTLGESMSEIASKPKTVTDISSGLGDPQMGVPLCYVVKFSDDTSVEIFDYAKVFYKKGVS